ncbi:hypothetical protein K437DRAFT_246888 [Tilletiaria anomala UBC 951]|uniref:Glutamine amidotransferase type-2 domain-containing protein n=1 Tax=Tilletiaria anomala (strain ATCC 24038 / CBS 436.72 / UBC 951) TaxID=1037660 RepID=A0A066W4C0_TILAU|nr:uncharacterized protein K437DRAFT_246888 [Tilletiaria anomala UBC 951]KDN45909.1 hypothetical protein K437DRAFT_246888 [Tilletiaria anomala UBC 951]
MCGITLVLRRLQGNCGDVPPDPQLEWEDDLVACNALRGPDITETVTVSIPTPASSASSSTTAVWQARLSASVLALRGPSKTAQPFFSPEHNLYFAWNGQIFEQRKQYQPCSIAKNSKKGANFIERRIKELFERVWNGENDGKAIFEALTDILEECEKQVSVTGPSPMAHEVLASILDEVEGPFAFVLIEPSRARIFYGRDMLGRRSLLHTPRVSLNSSSFAGDHGFLLCSCSTEAVVRTFARIDSEGSHGVREPAAVESTDGESTAPNTADIQLTNRLEEVPTSSYFLLTLHSEPESKPWPRIRPDWRCVQSAGPSEDPVSMQQQRSDKRKQNAENLLTELKTAVASRLPPIQCRTASSVSGSHSSSTCSTALLFSGGLDCTVLALLAHAHLPPEEQIDLINVAFENPRSLKAQETELSRRSTINQSKRGKVNSTKDDKIAGCCKSSLTSVAQLKRGPYDTPDRLTGLEALAELQRLAPSREWVFVQVNVPSQEYKSRKGGIVEKMWPNATVMDLSIAAALHFAAHGRGVSYSPLTTASDSAANPGAAVYETPARVLLSGLGADELFGGYARHRTAYSKEGWSGLTKELQLDLDRLPERNLGRDDRMIACTGREARYPFLATNVVTFACSLPAAEKANIPLGEGIGDKMVLRDVARLLGLQDTAERRKRAIQFGARSAKMNEGDGKVKGQALLSRD